MGASNHRAILHSVCLALAALLVFSTYSTTAAQEVVVAPSEAPVAAQPAQSGPQPNAGRRGGKPDAPPGAQPGAQPNAEGKPGGKDKKPEGEGEKKDGAAGSVKRPDKPPRVPDPREFDVALDDKGHVPQFNFIGQPWPDVMQWLAKLYKASLDWDELPSDYLNLMTDRSYPLDEVHDRINKALHARGYTAVLSGKDLSVFKIEKLDPSVARHVTEEELYNLKRYDVVKVSFDLPPEMDIEKAKEDVKQLLSPHSKVFPLVTTRRLLVMDSVANLRTVSELLNQERVVQSGRIIPRNFPLKHARPQHVIETLYVILGVDPKAKPAQTDPQAQQQQMQMLQQMQQQGRDVSKMMPKTDGPKVYLAYNRQLNSVMANAPPEQMKIIEQTIALLDVPFGGAASAADIANGEPSDNGRTMKKYPLTTLDPENFMQTLAEIGGLSPYTEFKVDSKSKTLFALASATDHVKINELIDQFDGTGRKFKVIPLRLPADSVAATIYKLMAGQAEEEEDDDDRGYGWYPWDRDRNDKKDKPQQGFGVDADIENNRLLLWANDAELERVRELLIELGEIPSGARDPRAVRFYQPADGQSSDALLEQIRNAWSSAGGNQLIIKKAPTTPAKAEEKEKKTDGQTQESAEAKSDRSAAIRQAPRITAQFVQLEAAGNEAKEDAAAGTAEAAKAEEQPEIPPITITITDDGRLMLSSPDTAALDRLEELIDQLSPPQKRFKVYRLSHMPASHMYWDLKDYFEQDLEDDSGDYVRDWYGFRVPSGSKDKSTGLAKRRKLMITYDVPSNSILVANASASQTAEIEQLIAEFDRPAPQDSVEVRETASIKIHFSRPSVIAAAVKEVYRDLLSSRDKEFDRGDQKGDQRGGSERVTVISYGGSSSGSGGGSNRPSPLKVAFDGALSLGADDVSGILIVSAQKGIFDDIVRMVRELDYEAAPRTSVRVHRLNGNVTAEALQKALDEAVGKSWLGSRPEPTGQTADQQQNRDGDGDRDRGRDRGDRRRNGDND